MKRLLINGAVFLSLLFLFSGCDKTEPLSPIFSGTTYIAFFSPSGLTSSSMPTFTWTAPDSEVVYQVVGVFSNTISVKEKTILNPQDCVAMWTTGMSGSAGSVDFANFMVVSNGVLTSTAASSSTLNNSLTYHWAVWGYNSGMEVTHSSGQKSFTVP